MKRKNKIKIDLGNSEKLFSKTFIEFDSIREFLDTYHPENNTLVVPLCPYPDIYFESNPTQVPEEKKEELLQRMDEIDKSDIPYEEKSSIANEYYAKVYDDRLFRIRVRHGKKFYKLNVKKLGDPKHTGLLGSVHLLIEWIEKELNNIEKFAEKTEELINTFGILIPKETAINIENSLNGFFDKTAERAQRSYSRHLKAPLVIWIPLWMTKKASAILINLFDRIEIIIS